MATGRLQLVPVDPALNTASAQAAPSFALGAQVKWPNHPRERVMWKIGEIVAVVAPGKRPPATLFRDIPSFSPVRKQESYVVRVQVGPSPGGTFRHYWPRVSALQLVLP